MTKQFFKFVVVGFVAACANVGSRVAFGVWMSYLPSIILAYGVGLGTAFVLNRIFVFTATTNRLHHQILWFAIVNAVAVGQTVAVSFFLARIVFPTISFHWHVDTIAHAIGVGVPVFTSYLGHKHLTFPMAKHL